MRTIIETYGLGAIPISHIFDEVVEPPHEVIDVDYEDITDQCAIPQNANSTSNKTLLLEQHINYESHVNSDNK